ncbi:MAG: DNA-3-methyladenine glycosylase [bacterium]|nr:DNA-3-methyladenine glycosylase [bacterium]
MDKFREKVFSEDFFNRPVLTVAKEMLGKFLIRRRGGKETALMITEVEAYDGFKDKASHASRGKTERNKVMFGGAGNWYVYFTYGMHWMLNIVTGSKDYPAAVLIRGTKEISGPGRITKYLKIDKKFNAKPANKKTGLWIAASPKRAGEPRPKGAGRFKIKRLPRVGVAYAGEWADKPYRFYLRDIDNKNHHAMLQKHR